MIFTKDVTWTGLLGESHLVKNRSIGETKLEQLQVYPFLRSYGKPNNILWEV